MKKLIFAILIAGACAELAAQQTKLSYDGIPHATEGQLLAATVFEDEMLVVFNARFSPAEKCILDAVELGFGVVKFERNSGEDTLVVWVFEASDVPPQLTSVGRTYLFPLGDQGVPRGNISLSDPFASGAREVRTFVLNPPVVIAPKREFVIGVMLRSRQRHELTRSVWNGLALLIKKDSPEYERYRRYAVLHPPYPARNPFATEAGRAAVCLRAVVQYDPTLPDTPLTGVEPAEGAQRLEIGPNTPNPFTSATSIPFALKHAAEAALTVHDMLGREVAKLEQGMLQAGRHTAVLDAASLRLPAGVYVVRLASGADFTARIILRRK